MTEPIPVAGGDVFEFIGQSRLAVLLVSLHPVHAFNSGLARELVAVDASIALGTTDLADVITAGGPALRYLHQGLRHCGAPSAFGVLPGYYLFRSGAVAAWSPGLPTLGDALAIARGAMLGAVWSGISHDHDWTFITQALRAVADQAAGHRVAAAFRYVIEHPPEERRWSTETDPAPVDDVYWAYQMLGVLPTATDREVYEAWRRKRRECHPDLVAGDADEFERRSRASREINRARDIVVEYRSGGARKAS